VDFQIMLLPHQDFWAWARASSQYVQTYGLNLTSDPVAAANYMAPGQVVSFPVFIDAYPEQGDLVRWFDANYPGIRVDPVPAETPENLAAQLQIRLDAQDRYGQRQRPFYLLWPTKYPVITQKFGANPQIYRRFGMPGHEGLDIRALPYTNITSAADGVVYEIHANPKDHPYGIHIRIRHQFGYKTIYGHLAKPMVRWGQQVSAGDVIGTADTTGASTASHLHFSLKQDGATARKETDYPKDILDPTPFMVWPDSSKSLDPQARPAGKCLIGASAQEAGGPSGEGPVVEHGPGGSGHSGQDGERECRARSIRRARRAGRRRPPRPSRPSPPGPPRRPRLSRGRASARAYRKVPTGPKEQRRQGCWQSIPYSRIQSARRGLCPVQGTPILAMAVSLSRWPDIVSARFFWRPCPCPRPGTIPP